MTEGMWKDFGPEPTDAEINEMIEQLKNILRGNSPLLQGAALAAIVSMFFAGLNPGLREEAIDRWLKAMRGLIKVNEAALLEHYGEVWDEVWEKPN